MRFRVLSRHMMYPLAISSRCTKLSMMHNGCKRGLALPQGLATIIHFSHKTLVTLDQFGHK